MKKLFLILLLPIFLTSCGEEKDDYPRYSLTKINKVPDSLKTEYRLWITETIGAASQHMFGGDYEDVDMTIIQAERTATKLFSVQIIGLNKEIDDRYYNDVKILPEHFTKKEQNIFIKLIS